MIVYEYYTFTWLVYCKLLHRIFVICLREKQTNKKPVTLLLIDSTTGLFLGKLRIFKNISGQPLLFIANFELELYKGASARDVIPIL